MKHLWSKINLAPKEWKRIFKALNCLEFLVRNGAPRIVNDLKDDLYKIRTLQDMQFTEEGADKCTGIREKAKLICELISEPTRLEEEREFSRKNRDKFRGISNTENGVGSSPTYHGYGSTDLGKGYGETTDYDYKYKQGEGIFGKKSDEKAEKKKKKKKKRKVTSSDSESPSSESDSDESSEEERPKKISKKKKKAQRKKEKKEKKENLI